jgi:hypothetical protein
MLALATLLLGLAAAGIPAGARRALSRWLLYGPSSENQVHSRLSPSTTGWEPSNPDS